MKYNNAESTLSADITASGTSIVLKTGEGALFPSTGYPEKMKIEHFEGGVVTKREVITISWRTGDILTISSRASEACVQDESLTTKTRTQNAFSFSSGDTISMTITEEDYNGIIETLNTTIPNTYATKDEVKKSELVYGASSTGTDAYAITVSWITAYQDGMTFRVKSDVANTGACTLDVNGIWAKAVKKQQGTVDLTDGDWAANWIATLVYNSSLDVWQYASQEAVVVSSAVSSTSSDFVCGESITAWQPVYQDSVDNKIYWTDASNINKIKFIGFAKSSGILDDTIWVDTAGINSNQTSLTTGSTYYLSDTSWISTTPWTNNVLVWIATNSSDILINTLSYKKWFWAISSMSNGVTYTANNDWIVYWYVQGSTSVVQWFINWWLVAEASILNTSNDRESISFPVSAWNTYRVSHGGTPSAYAMKFIPITF